MSNAAALRIHHIEMDHIERGGRIRVNEEFSVATQMRVPRPGNERRGERLFRQGQNDRVDRTEFESQPVNESECPSDPQVVYMERARQHKRHGFATPRLRARTNRPGTAGRSRLQYRFVSVEEVRRGGLGNGSYRILMLPHTIALSPIEAKKIKDFVERGGIVVADGQPGIFDEHGRRLAEPALSEIFAGSATHARTGKGEAFYAAFPVDRGRESGRGILVILKAAGVKPRFQLSRLDGERVSDVETHIFDNGKATIVALQRQTPNCLGFSTRRLRHLQFQPHPGRHLLCVLLRLPFLPSDALA